MTRFKKLFEEDSSDAQFDILVQQFIDDFNFTSESTQKQVYNKVFGFLKNRYKGQVSVGRLKMFAEDFTESICLKLDISEGGIKENFSRRLNESVRPKFVVGDIIRHIDYPDSQGMLIKKVDFENQQYRGIPEGYIGTHLERYLTGHYVSFDCQDEFILIGGPNYTENYEDTVIAAVGESKIYNKIMRNISREVKKAINEHYSSYKRV